jgi:hypothetical protein
MMPDIHHPLLMMRAVCDTILRWLKLHRQSKKKRT